MQWNYDLPGSGYEILGVDCSIYVYKVEFLGFFSSISIAYFICSYEGLNVWIQGKSKYEVNIAKVYLKL